MFAIRVVEVFVCGGAVMNGSGGSLQANEKDRLGECERENFDKTHLCGFSRKRVGKRVEGRKEDGTLYGLPYTPA